MTALLVNIRLTHDRKINGIYLVGRGIAHHLFLITYLVGDAAPYSVDFIGYGLAEYLQ